MTCKKRRVKREKVEEPVSDRNPKLSLKRNNVKSRLKCIMLNARSLRNKINEFKGYVSLEQPDIIVVTETWVKLSKVDGNIFSERDSKQEYQIDGYDFYYYDRKYIEGGGVIIYSKSSLNAIQLENIKDGDTVESVWIEIRDRENEKIKIGGLYRPPEGCSVGGVPRTREENKAIEEKLLEEMRIASIRNPAIILGDFNYPGIDWNNNTSALSGQEFLFGCQDLGLIQLVTDETRGNAILDLVLTNDLNLVSDIEVGEPLGRSDHSMVRFDINFNVKSEENNVKVPDFNRAKWLDFINEINRNEWETIFHNKNAHEMWNDFKNIIYEAQERHIPTREIRANKLKKTMVHE